MEPIPADADLLARSVDEPALFAGLYERHVAVRRYIVRRIGDGAADDVASEVFARAFRGGPTTAPRMTPTCHGCLASPTM